MQQSTQISAFGSILLFLVLGTAFVLVTLLMSKIISPKKPNPEKLTTYECGEEPTGSSWMQFNMRFYVIALVFLLFDVELIFLFPWSTVFGNKELIAAVPSWGWLSFFEMTIFIGILLVGLVYVWKKGDLNWVKPQPVIPAVDTKVPSALYQQLNLENYRVRAFVHEPVTEEKKETAPTERTERRQYIPKTVTGNTEKAAEIVQQTNTEEQPKPAYQPRFKPNVASTETKPEESPVTEKTEGEPTEKPAYKPRFKPQVAQKAETEESTPTENTTAAKPAYVPKFKPRVASDSGANLEVEATAEPQETKAEEPVKQAYIPKFKPRMATANNKEEKAEEKPEITNEVQEVKTEEPVKQAYVPKFKPRMVQKSEEIKADAGDIVPAENATTIADKPIVEENSESTAKPSGYKPRFKPTMVKKQEDNSTNNTGE